jgi:hypothetical protein
MKRIPKLLLVIAIAATAMPTHAAVINVTLQIEGYYDPDDFSPLPPIPPCCDPVGVHVGVYMAVKSLGPGEDSFGSANFSIRPTGFYASRLTPDLDAGGYAANPIPNVDSNGPSTPGGLVPLFPTNADLGVDSQDYVDILVKMADGAFTNSADPRRTVGEAGSSLGSPILLGDAFFEWDPLGLFPEFALQGLVVTAKTTAGQFVPAKTPEPGTLAMAGLSVLGLAFRRRLA